MIYLQILLCFIVLGLIALAAKIAYHLGKLSEKNRLDSLYRQKIRDFYFPKSDVIMAISSAAEMDKIGYVEQNLYEAGFGFNDILYLLSLCNAKSTADLIEKEECKNLLIAYLQGINKGLDRCSEIFND